MTCNPHGLRPETRLVHGGVRRTHHGETAEALFLTSGYVYDDAEQAEATITGDVDHYQYSRYANPTISMLEERLCLIEGAEACRTTATGMAAVNAAMLSHLRQGDRVVASRALFGSCHWLVSTLLPRFGITGEFVDAGDLDQWRAALSRPAQLVLLETPSNPMLEIVDLPAVCDMAHKAGAIVVVDNVFATPLLQQPLRLGADVVVYSCTKHMDGQGRVMGGAVLSNRKWIEDTLQIFVRNTGPSMSAFTAWVLLKGLETLPLRVEAASRAAAEIADFLAAHRSVSRVWYPTRTDHPQHELAMAQMTAGGTVVTFEVARGSHANLKDSAFAVMNGFGLIALSNNLGDSKSLATHPATTTHMRIGAEERARLGITDGVIRLSIGLEHLDDLKDDLQRAVERVDGQQKRAAE
ncbi:MAG: O-succinylhomoserine sulfhydrylase [Acetobacteraceae bacterium]|nr:O-succinylhomoserine sulfhydrylase [Acetobacteraceae bacterium]